MIDLFFHHAQVDWRFVFDVVCTFWLGWIAHRVYAQRSRGRRP